MSKKLEQILDLLLNEETQKAEEMLHEYVVTKAREEYERVLDETDDAELEDDIEELETEELGEADDEVEDFEDEIEADDEMGDDEFADDEMGDDEFADDEFANDEMGDDEFADDLDSEEGDIEGKVDDLEAELEDLRAEFEALMSAEAGEEEHADDFDVDGDMDDSIEGEDEEMMDSVEYDLEEATNFSKTTGDQPMKGAKLKGSESDNDQSSFTKAPKPTAVKNGNTGPVKAKDGSAGKEAAKKAAKHDATNHNMGVKPSKATKPSDANYQ